MLRQIGCVGFPSKRVWMHAELVLFIEGSLKQHGFYKLICGYIGVYAVSLTVFQKLKTVGFKVAEVHSKRGDFINN